MALTDCPECGNQVSDDAKKCPDCGKKLKRTSVDSCVSCIVIFFILGVAMWVAAYVMAAI